MRFASLSSLAVLAFAFLQLPTSGAASAEPGATSSHSCGVTPREAIAAAEQALSEKSSDAERRALACLLAAVKALEAERLDALRGNDKARMLRVPRNP